jgi:S-formylglutathione hydrolase
MELIKRNLCFGGAQEVWRHQSAATKTAMEFAVYLPPQAGDGGKVPVLFYLSGLTCTWANATDKAGAQRYAAEHGVIVVMPDTSPRGDGVADDAGYDLGQGAGFYVNATREPWAVNYRMFDYVAEELPRIVFSSFPADAARAGVCGHSMGGHGALLCALKKPELFRSCSAFAPICAPSQCPWGQKIFGAYLGDDKQEWKKWDACELAADSAFRGKILVDQGGDDEFLREQLKPDSLQAALAQTPIDLELNIRKGYDHSYFFIATFFGSHIAHHAAALR